jgi:hypothetical protein
VTRDYGYQLVTASVALIILALLGFAFTEAAR